MMRLRGYLGVSLRGCSLLKRVFARWTEVNPSNQKVAKPRLGPGRLCHGIPTANELLLHRSKYANIWLENVHCYRLQKMHLTPC